MKNRKFGRKNTIKLNPLEYNIGLIGESGIGKTTTLIETAEKLVSEDGYMLLSLGKEDAVDAISGAVFEEVPDWDTFYEITQDILDNRNTDYKDLKVLIYDTIDQLFDITEDHVIELHNSECKADKRTKSINGAFGGFGKGQEKVIDLILDRLWELKKVGISYIVVGHTKRKTLNDITTGEPYEMITTNMSEKYFNAIKTKLHFLGVATVDREIELEKKKQRMGEDKEIGKIIGESRIITFRDDNFSIDSKSRFAEIASKIPLTSDDLIKAMNDAILTEQKKDGIYKSIEEVKKDQEEEKEIKVEKELENKKLVINEERNLELIGELQKIYSSASDDAKKELVVYLQEKGLSFKKENAGSIPTTYYEEALAKFK